MTGGYESSETMMLIGRGLIGIATEALFNSQLLLITNWFINYELEFATAISSIVPFIGSFLNGVIIPRMVTIENPRIGDAYAIGFYLCLFSVFMVLLIVVLDYTVENNDA